MCVLELICHYRKGKQRKMEDNTMAKRYEIKQAVYRQAGKRTWETIKIFDNAGKADEWLMSYCRAKGYSITDFIIKAMQ